MRAAGAIIRARYSVPSRTLSGCLFVPVMGRPPMAVVMGGKTLKMLQLFAYKTDIILTKLQSDGNLLRHRTLSKNVRRRPEGAPNRFCLPVLFLPGFVSFSRFASSLFPIAVLGPTVLYI